MLSYLKSIQYLSTNYEQKSFTFSNYNNLFSEAVNEVDSRSSSWCIYNIVFKYKLQN